MTASIAPAYCGSAPPLFAPDRGFAGSGEDPRNGARLQQAPRPGPSARSDAALAHPPPARSGHPLIGADFRNDAYRFQLALHATITLPRSCLRLERPYLRRNLASFAQAAVPVAFGFRSATIVIGWPAEALPQLLETIGRMRRPDRDRSVIGIKLRRGAAIIDPRHLPRELAEIARRLGRDKQR